MLLKDRPCQHLQISHECFGWNNHSMLSYEGFPRELKKTHMVLHSKLSTINADQFCHHGNGTLQHKNATPDSLQLILHQEVVPQNDHLLSWTMAMYQGQ